MPDPIETRSHALLSANDFGRTLGTKILNANTRKLPKAGQRPLMTKANLKVGAIDGTHAGETCYEICIVVEGIEVCFKYCTDD